jgi:hypothetical protein
MARNEPHPHISTYKVSDTSLIYESPLAAYGLGVHVVSAKKLGSRQIAIILLAFTTAAIHFSRAAADPEIRVLFALNGLGYLALVGLLYTPRGQAAKRHRLVCGMFIGYTALTIALYLVWGLMSGEWAIPLGPIDKLAEVALIGLLWRDLQDS